MGRKFVIDTGYQSVGAAAQDLLEVLLPAGVCAVVHRAKVMQSSDESSSESEMLQINLKRGIGSTSGSGGGSPSAIKLDPGDAAHGLTLERNNTTQAVAGGGSLEVVEPGVFSVLAGEWEYCPVPELRPVFGPSNAIILSLDEAPADALTLRAILELEILGG